MKAKLSFISKLKNKTKAITTAKQEESCGMGKLCRQQQGTWDAPVKNEQCRLVETELFCLTVSIGKGKYSQVYFPTAIHSKMRRLLQNELSSLVVSPIYSTPLPELLVAEQFLVTY